MNEQQYEDLVQLIKATAAQTESILGSKIAATEERLSSRLDEVEVKVDGGLAAMGEAIDNLGAQADADKSAVERRLAEHDRVLANHAEALYRLKPNAA